jgi:hypothetical protein
MHTRVLAPRRRAALVDDGSRDSSLRRGRRLAALVVASALATVGMLAPPGTAASRSRGVASRISGAHKRYVPEVVTYSVEVDPATGIDAAEVERTVATVLSDPRSWGPIKRTRFVRATTAPARVRIRVLQPEDVDAACVPFRTEGVRSCTVGWTIVLNALRWVAGAEPSKMELPQYRTYLINHEMGHALGETHAPCPSPGALAPVMLQQTIGLDGCRPNPWVNPAAGVVRPVSSTQRSSSATSSSTPTTTTPPPRA